MSDHPDDAQRTLERKALANVRGLLDKFEAEEREHSSDTLKLVVMLVIAAIGVVCVMIGVKLWSGSSTTVESKVIAQPVTARSEQSQAHQGQPRKKYVDERPKEYRFAAYMDSWRRQIERIGNLNYPEEARRARIHGSLELTVGIKADGGLESVEINTSSKSEVLDQAAIRIVRLAAPFERLPDSIKVDTDILYITRTWTFRPGEQFNAK